ncbi:MAG TPA: trypsin-like serine protease [Pilimelia sp.]|nr:trypsin-like serine protease [Pilimelia sp.]
MRRPAVGRPGRYRYQTTMTCSSDLVARNVFTAIKSAGACTRRGDSGGPMYAKNANGIIYAVGVISGGNEASTGTPSRPCNVAGTEMRNIWLGSPGDLMLAD